MTTVIIILVLLVFALVFFLIFFTLGKAARERSKNNRSPRLTVPAKIVTRRSDVSRHMRTQNTMHAHSVTRYYVTFEFSGGDRLELPVSASEYGYLAEGDRGNLRFQGTRFLGFDRFSANS
ncbi:MAG: DUF2500 domain-containing protein [Oscillospiraceae bacterium]|jgi:hypothetical protein|nr:DUF2500 domain-containing protein [Oscillospiraceae bacterium]